MKKYFITFLEIFLILIIIFEIGFVVFESTLRPVMQFDALSNWAWKAKILFYQPHEFFTKTSELFLGGVHPNYPFVIPLIMAGIYYLFGQVNDMVVGLFFALHFVILIGFIYWSLKSLGAQPPKRFSKKQRTFALVFTALLSTIPLLSYHGFSSYADLPLTLYFTIASIFLFKYMAVQPRTYYLVIAGIFAGLSTLAKNEGLMLSAVLFIVFILYTWKTHYRGRVPIVTIVKQFTFFIVPFLILFLPWFAFKLYFGLGYSNVPGPLFTGFHLEVVPAFLQQIFLSNSFHIWPGIFLIILFFKAPLVFSRPYVYILLIIFGVVCAYLIIYIFTPSYEFALAGTIIGRNILTIIPLTIFLAGLLFQQKNQKQ